MVDWNRAAEYLCKDFVGPQLHVPPLLSLWVSKFISQFSVRLLRAIDCIPVGQGEELFETYRQSVDALAQGKSILIFPEDPSPIIPITILSRNVCASNMV